MRKMSVEQKKIERTKFTGKSYDYQDGYLWAEEYFEHLVKGGNTIGSVPFRIYVEAVAQSIRKKEPISNERIKLIDYILKWSDSDFNKGVRDLLVERANNYRGLQLIEEMIHQNL